MSAPVARPTQEVGLLGRLRRPAPSTDLAGPELVLALGRGAYRAPRSFRYETVL